MLIYALANFRPNKTAWRNHIILTPEDKSKVYSICPKNTTYPKKLTKRIRS